MNLEFFENAPPWQRYLFIGLVFALVIGLYVWLLYLPKHDEYKRLAAAVDRLNNEIQVAEAKVRRLDELKRRYEMLKARLEELKEQLPTDREVTGLLKQISDKVLQAGLRFKVWKPEPRKTQGDLYEEIPIHVEVLGGYHNVGMFFSHVSRLPRIVNLKDIEMGKPVSMRGITVVHVKFKAVTFAAAESKAGKTGASRQGGGRVR